MFGGRDCPLFRNKFPLVQRLRVHYPFLLDIIHQIEAKVLVRRENNTVFQQTGVDVIASLSRSL